jgi:hypothetical protein
MDNFILTAAVAAGLAWAFVKLAMFSRMKGLSQRAIAEAGQIEIEQTAKDREMLVGAAFKNPDAVSRTTAEAFSEMVISLRHSHSA